MLEGSATVQQNSSEEGCGQAVFQSSGPVSQHAHALTFSSLNGTRYLFDSATSTLHPWPWGVEGEVLDRLYEVSDEDLCARADFSPALARYVRLWRKQAGAFGQYKADSTLNNTAKKAPAVQGVWPSLMANLILVVTDACNLRCRYCILGGTYEGFKPLREQHMSWETAKAAVDHFIALNSRPAFQAMHDRKINISFFGGEPLLRGDLIQRVVEYAESKESPHSGYWIDFGLTTNLTYLPDKLAAFLAEHEVGVLVSMDGPERTHDACRVDAAGHGSFKRMRQNLEKFRAIAPAYYARHVQSVITINGNSDLRAIYEFFESGDPLVPKIGFLGFVRDLENSEFHRLNPIDRGRLWEQYEELREEYRQRKRKGLRLAKGEFLYRLFEEGLRILHQRLMLGGETRRMAYTGTCQPGRRLAVSTDGQFHMCERINEHFPIGDVQSGVDWARTAAILQRYYDALPDCDNCWARPICGTCMANNCRGDQFDFGTRCDHLRFELAHRLRLLCTILEENPTAFDEGDGFVEEARFLEPIL